MKPATILDISIVVFGKAASVAAKSFLAAIMLVLMGAPGHAVPISTFDDMTLQGWSPGVPNGFGAYNGTLEVISPGGNPNGFMRTTQTGGSMGLPAQAPDAFHGNLSIYAGIEWDQIIFPASFVLTGQSILLQGTDGTIYQSDSPITPSGVWTQRFVAFDPTFWTLFSGSADFNDVITDVAELFITMDVGTNFGVPESGVDNVGLRPVPLPAALPLFAAALGCLALVRRRKAG